MTQFKYMATSSEKSTGKRMADQALVTATGIAVTVALGTGNALGNAFRGFVNKAADGSFNLLKKATDCFK